jgi:hypothetical protein
MIIGQEFFLQRKGHFDNKKTEQPALMLGCLPALLASENL